MTATENLEARDAATLRDSAPRRVARRERLARRRPQPQPVEQPVTRLRSRLIAADATTLSVIVTAATIAVFDRSWPRRVAIGVLGVAVAAIGVGLGVAALVHLYRARVCAVRAKEKARLALVAIATVGTLALGVSVLTESAHAPWVIVATLAAFRALVGERLVFHQWLRAARARGRFGRPVVIVGINGEAQEVGVLLRTHPELGLRVVGVIGDPYGAPGWDLDVPWWGDLRDLAAILDETHVPGALVIPSAIGCDEVRRVVHTLSERGVHVQLSPGVTGIDQRRLRPLPLAHEPLFYVEASKQTRWSEAVKRSLDIAVAGVGLVIVAPVLVVAAVAIKLQDRGPVLFRQVRVGRYGQPFEFLKLRTMRPASDTELAAVAHRNQRTGPLFKDVADPRRTRIGRVLEAASIDELPQLINVLRGDMSLVGPRPALPHEVAAFDDELLMRHEVTPGITGLWQIESRDNPSFAAYRRLDLFYVENWSDALDAAILFATFGVVTSRAVQRVSRRARRNASVAGSQAAGT